MTLQEVMTALESYGNEQTKKIFMKHGAKEPFFGVKVGDMKVLQKKIKKDQELAEQLYDTGNGDAMYIAGLIADESKVTKKLLDKWVKNASWYMISEYTVPWVAADSGLAFECGLEWIESKEEKIASAGWSALSSFMSVQDPDEKQMKTLIKLVDRVKKDIHKSDNRVRYTMNNFIIAAGSFVSELADKAQNSADLIGKVDVEMGGTACKVPDARSYIQKVIDKGRLGKKKKMARC